MPREKDKRSKTSTAREAKQAGRVIRQFCLSRTGDDACKWCPIRNICGTEPYTWEV